MRWMPRPVLSFGKVSVLLGLIARRNPDAAYNKKNQDTKLYFLIFIPIHPQQKLPPSRVRSCSQMEFVDLVQGDHALQYDSGWSPGQDINYVRLARDLKTQFFNTLT
ncbi:uncharacterized protein NPIL_693181, partial [Nephila pilipes]